MDKIYLNEMRPVTPDIDCGLNCINLFSLDEDNRPQSFYFKSRGICCKKVLAYNGYPNKIYLYPEESWATNASSTYWTIKPCRWRYNTFIINEFISSRRFTTYGKLKKIKSDEILITGSFKKRSTDPDFKLYLSSSINLDDFNMGYCLTGKLERGYKLTNCYETTHFAVVRRKWPSIAAK